MDLTDRGQRLHKAFAVERPVQPHLDQAELRAALHSDTPPFHARLRSPNPSARSRAPRPVRRRIRTVCRRGRPASRNRPSPAARCPGRRRKTDCTPRAPGRRRRDSAPCRAAPDGRATSPARDVPPAAGRQSTRANPPRSASQSSAPRATCGSRRRNARTESATAAWPPAQSARNPCASCTLAEPSIAQPVARTAMMSL